MKIQIIIGSTRPNRVGPQIAKWVVENLPGRPDVEYEIVDIADWNLPFLDEPKLPSMGNYQNEHTKLWSQKIKEADGYIFLTPEYNAGYPASLKNAIDYLYHEWANKPVLIISYGIRGGAGAGAQLRQVAERLKMRLTESTPAFNVNRDNTDQSGQVKDIEIAFESYIPQLQLSGQELIGLVV